MGDHVFRYYGRIRVAERETGDGSHDALFLGGDEDPLAERVQDDTERHRGYEWQETEPGRGYWRRIHPLVTARWFVSDGEKTFDDAEGDLLRVMDGQINPCYADRWSEITGYLWTDEWIKVGDRDILAPLRAYEGRFAGVEIIFHPSPDRA